MIDYFNLTDTTSNNQIFYTDNSSTSNSWQTWSKPKGISYVYITCIGGGGGGGSSSNVAGNGGGGGGGGSSSITKILIPSNLIPDTLFIQVGSGGAGGTSSLENAVNGDLSYVSISPNTLASNVIIASGTQPAQRGTRGTSGSGGLGGLGGTVFTSSIGILSILGIWQSIAGRNGSSGGFASGGSNLTSIAAGTFLSGGAGGGGSASGIGYAGGSIQGVGGIITFNITGGAPQGGDGRRGYMTTAADRLMYSSRKFPLLVTGGSGGAGSGSFGISGGDGGAGSMGCGGGGAGSQDGSTASNRPGGRGGNGLVLITSF